MQKLAKVRIALCGAGALGSNLADNLARQGVRALRVIDRDRIEEHNVGTQLYGLSDAGAWKVDALRAKLFRATGVEVEAIRKELTAQNARPLLKGADIVVDVFDNSASRRLVQEQVRAQGVPCLHVGLAADYCEAIWDERYRVPSDQPAADGAGDACHYALARNLVLLAVAIASETLVHFIASGAKRNWSATLRDFRVTEVGE